METEAKKTEELIDKIEVLLAAQKESIKAGDLSAFERLADELGTLVTELTENGDYPSKQQKTQLIRMYDNIKMAIETEKASIEKNIARTKENKRLVKAYSNKTTL